MINEKTIIYGMLHD